MNGVTAVDPLYYAVSKQMVNGNFQQTNKDISHFVLMIIFCYPLCDVFISLPR